LTTFPALTRQILHLFPSHIRFCKDLYKLFVKFLVENYGIKKLQEFLKNYINNPDAYQKLFIDVYSIDLDEVLNNYLTSLNVR
jgi:hypothetical protein